MSWSTSELRVRLAPLKRFKPSSKIFYWPFQGGTSFVDLLCFCSVLCLLCFVRVCLYVLRGHLLGKGWPLGSRLWCLLWVCNFPIGILGQVWYLIVSIPDLCNLTYFYFKRFTFCLGKLCAIFFAASCPNYAQWATRYHLDHLYSGEAQPATCAMQETGAMSTWQMNKPFVRSPVDWNLEQIMSMLMFHPD